MSTHEPQYTREDMARAWREGHRQGRRDESIVHYGGHTNGEAACPYEQEKNA